MAMNFQRGLRRLTTLVSVLLCLVAAVRAVRIWSGDVARWEGAVAQPYGAPVVLVPRFSLVRFVRGTEPAVMLQALDGALALPMDQYLMDWDPERCQAGKSEPGTDLAILLTPPQAPPGCFVAPVGGVQIGYVLDQEWKPRKRSRLLSREDVLRAEANGVLLPELSEGLAAARQKTAFPGRASPPSRHHLLMLTLAVVAAGLAPWFVFYSLLWIVRGFRA